MLLVVRNFFMRAFVVSALVTPPVIAAETHEQANPQAEPPMADIPQAAKEFRIKQMFLDDLPIPDAEAPRFSRAPKPTHVSPHHTVVMEHYFPPKRAGKKGSAFFKITHYTLSSDGHQLLINTYRLYAPSACVNITHFSRVLRSEVTYMFRDDNQVLQFGMDAEGMRIQRFEIYTINPGTGKPGRMETHYPTESQP